MKFELQKGDKIIARPSDIVDEVTSDYTPLSALREPQTVIRANKAGVMTKEHGMILWKHVLEKLK